MRRSRPRLWPRHHHVKEQATERHADRERIGQLASPPVPTVSVSFIDRNVPVKDAPRAPSQHGPGGQDLTRTGYPRWRSSAAHSPDSRRPLSVSPSSSNAPATSSASPTSSPLAITISGGAGASASRSHHASSSGPAGSPPPVGAEAAGSTRRSCRDTSIATPLTRALSTRRLDARRVVIERRDRIPAEPGGGDREHAGPAPEVEKPSAHRQREHRLEAQTRGRVSARPERLRRVDHDLNRGPHRRLPRRSHRQPIAEHERPMKRTPPLRPIVGDLGSADLDERVAGRRGQVRQRRQLAGRAVDGVLDYP